MRIVNPYRTIYLGLSVVFTLLLLVLAVAYLLVRTLGFGPVCILLATVGLYYWAIRRPAPPQARPDETWGYASAMTYGLPSSPFQNLKDHQRAVQKVTVDAVLAYLDDGKDEGGAGVGARRRPRGPGPLTAVE